MRKKELVQIEAVRAKRESRCSMGTRRVGAKRGRCSLVRESKSLASAGIAGAKIERRLDEAGEMR